MHGHPQAEIAVNGVMFRENDHNKSEVQQKSSLPARQRELVHTSRPFYLYIITIYVNV
jgi:hypothetical protein